MNRCKQASELVLKKLKLPTAYNNGTGPVLPNASGVSLSSPRARQLALKKKLEDCNNTFITDVRPRERWDQNQERQNLATAAAKVKGCNRIVQRFQNVHKIYSRESHVYQCDFFRLMYFPPDHFLSMFRKSKPAVNVRTVGQVFLNGSGSSGDGSAGKALFQRNSQKNGFLRTQSTANSLGRLFESNPSNIPRNYAFLRRNLRVSLRKCFIKEWCALSGDLAVQEALSSGGAGTRYTDPDGRSRVGVAKDGYYMYQVLIFPDRETKKEFESCVKESVQVVSRLDWDEFLKPQSSKAGGKTWVQLANDRVRVHSLNKSLESNEIPFAVKRLWY
ncbi:hypothetical protein HG536_0E04670 [Torulaspora globosa]|uniref:Uncharacterized protein n=1 Tax=Torulaspora globosa TaxID=48254 RepID=A0A7G3ZJ70_9SACH|nr:uncharacterized protein HG536_0E04670 [Torulaspora globosa]QLL33556.1 hypothetical protein HG536_0E04670 [Torulaspora globosa]